MERANIRINSPFKTLVLGTPSAGKTVLLSSLYKRLSVSRPNEGTSFYLDSADKKHLLNHYHGMADEKRWPEPTRDFRSYLFTLCTNIESKDDNGNIHSEKYGHLAFEFFDIPGQSITDIHSDSSWAERVEKIGISADNLLILIDGYHVLKAINNQTSAGLYSQLDYLLPIVQRIPGKALHFVITKWDLIENYAAQPDTSAMQLLNIGKIMMRHSSFPDIIQQQKDQQLPTRLLPISAVGNNFAILDDNGNMCINPQTNPEPFFAELPVVLLLWDRLRLLQKQLEGHIRKNEVTLKNVKTIRKLLDVSTQVVDKIPVSDEKPLIIKLSVMAALGTIKNQLDTVIPGREGKLNTLTLQENDLLKILQEFIELVKKLECNFPASILSDI